MSNNLEKDIYSAIKKMRSLFMSPPTDLQTSSINAMSSSFSDGHFPYSFINDNTFFRYLCATRDHDVNKAIDMLSSTIRWREEFGLKDLYAGSLFFNPQINYYFYSLLFVIIRKMG